MKICLTIRLTRGSSLVAFDAVFATQTRGSCGKKQMTDALRVRLTSYENADRLRDNRKRLPSEDLGRKEQKSMENEFGSTNRDRLA